MCLTLGFSSPCLCESLKGSESFDIELWVVSFEEETLDSSDPDGTSQEI